MSYFMRTGKRKKYIIFGPVGCNFRRLITTLITINDNTAAVYASHDGCEGNEIVGLDGLCCCVPNSIVGVREREAGKLRGEGESEGGRKEEISGKGGGRTERGEVGKEGQNKP